MVFPIADDNTGRTITPYVNYALIALNVIVFVFFQGLGENDKFTYQFSTVPREIATGKDVVTPPRQFRVPATGEIVTVLGLQETPVPVYFTLLTSMFMHGGIAHLLGNMLFLWIFGDNIEDELGHLRYALYYLVCGLLASLAHVVATIAAYGVNSEQAIVPSLGASGAISGVLGGYILLFPHRRVTVFLFRMLTDVPAWVALGLWFLFQLIEGMGVLGKESGGGGVAYAAHIGGFVAGLALIVPFKIGRLEKPRIPVRYPSDY